MEVIKSGKADGKVTFTCPKCGCKFRAGADEYHIHPAYEGNLSSNTIYWSCGSCTTYYANCPECHYMCHLDDYGITYTSSSVTLDASKVNIPGTTTAGSGDANA